MSCDKAMIVSYDDVNVLLLNRPIHSVKFSASIGDQLESGENSLPLEYNGSQGANESD